MPSQAQGTFDVVMQREPPYDEREGASLARASVAKTFAGDLVGSSRADLLTAITSVQGSAAYVAIERVTGTLMGRQGTFVLQHSSTMNRGQAQQSITVVPDSATGELVGLRGQMVIEIVEGKHFYRFDIEYN
jgi:hypothetical protein